MQQADGSGETIKTRLTRSPSWPRPLLYVFKVFHDFLTLGKEPLMN